MQGVLDTLIKAFRLPELRKKMLFTILILGLYVVGNCIPVPALDREAFQTLILSWGQMAAMLDIMSAGGLYAATIFAMGITPYINSSIIMQLATVIFPPLEQMARDGEAGRKKMQKITRYFAVILAVVQSTIFCFSAKSAWIQTIPGWLAAVLIIMSFTAGTVLLVWLGERINEFGIGNGVSLIIFAGIVKRVPEMASSLYASATKINDMLVTKSAILGVVAAICATLLVLAFAIAIIIFVIYVQGAERRIPVQYSKKTVGRKLYGGQSSYLPLKVNQSGVMPVIFATSMLTFFNLIGTALFKPDTLLGKWSANFGTSPFYYVVFFLLIIGFTFFYSIIQFHPIEISNNLKTNGGFIPGIRPGRPTSEYIYNTVKRLNLADALFLSIVVLVPTIIGTLTGMQNVWFAGTSVLILTGVCSDLITQIETQLVARNQSGFLD